MTVHNFNSGPSILPKEVLEQASAAIHNFNNTGLSILEIGHRTTHFVEVVKEAQSIVKRLMELGCKVKYQKSHLLYTGNNLLRYCLYRYYYPRNTLEHTNCDCCLLFCSQ